MRLLAALALTAMPLLPPVLLAAPPASRAPKAAPAQEGPIWKDEALRRLPERLKALHRPLGRPRPGEWLYHNPERGQTFDEYLASDPVRPTAERRRVVLRPVGPFDASRAAVLGEVREGMEAFLGLPVTLEPALSDAFVPSRARRGWGRSSQLLAPWLLDEWLKDRVPGDAAAVVVLTSRDLWPGKGWNFVFGEADLENRVGVWSLARLGDPTAGPVQRNLFLGRALGTAVHETFHMFGLKHCTTWACLMNGSNSLEESDAQPLALCPSCLAKACRAMSVDPREHLRAVAMYCARVGLGQEAAFHWRERACLEGAPR